MRKDNRSSSKKREDFIFEAIKYKFNHPELLVQAFTCSSAIHERYSTKSYERLEFLGDSILKAIITELIFKVYPDENEGKLTHIRSELEKNQALSKISNSLNLTNYVIKGNGQKRNGKLSADLVESLIGAILVDSDFDYKVTRYHTLLLITDNIINGIDSELFFEYMDICRNEINQNCDEDKIKNCIKLNVKEEFKQKENLQNNSLRGNKNYIDNSETLDTKNDNYEKVEEVKTVEKKNVFTNENINFNYNNDFKKLENTFTNFNDDKFLDKGKKNEYKFDLNDMKSFTKPKTILPNNDLNNFEKNILDKFNGNKNKSIFENNNQTFKEEIINNKYVNINEFNFSENNNEINNSAPKINFNITQNDQKSQNLMNNILLNQMKNENPVYFDINNYDFDENYN